MCLNTSSKQLVSFPSCLREEMTQQREGKVLNFDFHKFNIQQEMKIFHNSGHGEEIWKTHGEVRWYYSAVFLHQKGKRRVRR